MAISSVTSKVIYVGDGATKTLAYPFKIIANGDLTVSRYVTATSAATVLILDTDYNVTGAGVDAGGNVLLTGSYAAGMPTGSNTVIQRQMDLTQTVDYVENDPFPANTHEGALDKLTMIEQQQQEEIDRCIKADINQLSSNVVYADFVTQAVAAASSATVAVSEAAAGVVSAAAALASETASASSGVVCVSAATGTVAISTASASSAVVSVSAATGAVVQATAAASSGVVCVSAATGSVVQATASVSAATGAVTQATASVSAATGAVAQAVVSVSAATGAVSEATAAASSGVVSVSAATGSVVEATAAASSGVVCVSAATGSVVEATAAASSGVVCVSAATGSVVQATASASSGAVCVSAATGSVVEATAAASSAAVAVAQAATNYRYFRTTLISPYDAYIVNPSIPLLQSLNAAITINDIEVTCDKNPNTQISGNLCYADAFIGTANPVSIDKINTTSGVLVDGSISNATVAAGKCIYLAFDAQPSAGIATVNFNIKYTYD